MTLYDISNKTVFDKVYYTSATYSYTTSSKSPKDSSYRTIAVKPERW